MLWTRVLLHTNSLTNVYVRSNYQNQIQYIYPKRKKKCLFVTFNGPMVALQKQP